MSLRKSMMLPIAVALLGIACTQTEEENRKRARGGFAPGSYFNVCGKCQQEFVGDKRAVRCEKCAYEGELIVVGASDSQRSKIEIHIDGGPRIGSALAIDFMPQDEYEKSFLNERFPFEDSAPVQLSTFPIMGGAAKLRRDDRNFWANRAAASNRALTKRRKKNKSAKAARRKSRK